MAYKGYTMKLGSCDISLDELLLQLNKECEQIEQFDDDENTALELLKEPAAAHDDLGL